MKFSLLFIFSFTMAFLSYGQTTLNDLFADGQYDLIIELLSKKKELSIEETTILARSHGRLGEYSNGIMYSEELMNKCLKAKDTINLLKAINVKTENLVDLGKYQEGLEFYEENNHYFREQDSTEYQLLCFKLGMIYFFLEKYEDAYNTYNLITIKKFRDLSLFKTNYGLILMAHKDYNQAVIYLNESAKSEKAMGYYISKHYINLSIIYMLQHKWDSAKIYIDSSAFEIRKDPSLLAEKSVYKNYFDFYSQTGQPRNAMRYLDSIENTNEMIFNEKLDEKLIALETSFEREHNLKQKLVVVDNELAYYQKARLWGVIIFLISILVFGGIITLLWIHNIKSQNQNILVEQKLLRSQMTPHFMFNSLAVLQGIILNKEYVKSINYLSKFSKLLRITLENSRDKIVPLKNEIEAIKNYIVVQNLGTKKSFQCNIDIDESINQETLLIPPMMLQPFIENAVEHAFINEEADHKITVKIKFEQKDLICTIEDNGVGLEQLNIKQKEEKKSLSTTITAERLKMLSKEFKVKTSLSIIDRKTINKSGTIVTIILPYKLK